MLFFLREPKNIQARYLRGMCFFEIDDFAAASHELSTIADQERQDLDFLFVLGIAYGKSGQTELSAETFSRLAQAGGDTSHLHLLMGKAFVELRDDVQADRELKKAAMGVPPLPLVHYYLGIVAKRHARMEEAGTEFSKEIEVSPDDPWAYEELGEIQLQEGQAKNAAKSLKIALSFNPDPPELLSGLAKAYTHLAEPENAVPLLAHAVKLEPGNGALHYQLGRAYGSVGRKQEAALEFAKAVSQMDAVTKAQVGAESL